MIPSLFGEISRLANWSESFPTRSQLMIWIGETAFGSVSCWGLKKHIPPGEPKYMVPSGVVTADASTKLLVGMPLS